MHIVFFCIFYTNEKQIYPSPYTQARVQTMPGSTLLLIAINGSLSMLLSGLVLFIRIKDKNTHFIA